MTLEFKEDVSDIYALKEHLWSGGLETLKDILELDAKHDTDFGERLYQHLEEVFMYDGETPDITTINDYLWFERDSIYEAIGLNENGEIPSIVDEARINGNIYTIHRYDMENIEKSGLFSDETINYIKEQMEDDDIYYLAFDELENNEEVTEEQIEFLENL